MIFSCDRAPALYFMWRGHWGGRPHIFTDCRENLPPVPEWNTDFPEVLICEMAENGNVNLVLGKALSVLPEAELIEPVRNPLHRNSLDFPLASTPAGGSVHILLAKDCSRSRVGAHVVQWSSADIATVHAMSAFCQKQTCAPHQPMSALPPIATAKADIGKPSCL